MGPMDHGGGSMGFGASRYNIDADLSGYRFI